MVMAIILFMGAVSGAHLNPVVSIAFMLARRLFVEAGAWDTSPSSCVGAALACLFLLAVFGNVKHLGATLPGPGYKMWQALMLEIALTATPHKRNSWNCLVSSERRRVGAISGWGQIALVGSVGGVGEWHAGDPARSFSPALLAGDLIADWVYVAGPLIGAAIAVGAATILRGGRDDPVARAAQIDISPRQTRARRR